MIEVNLTELENLSKEYVDKLTNRKKLRHEMIKFLKDSYWENSTEYCFILEFINDFFMETDESML